MHVNNNAPASTSALQIIQIVIAMFFAATLSACSKHEASQPAAAASMNDSDASSPGSSHGGEPAFRAAEEGMTSRDQHTAAGNIQTTYRAYYSGTELKSISEHRTTAAGTTEIGDYDFYGLRLIHYKGAALTSGAQIEIEFDMRGAVTKSTSDAGTVSTEQITAISNRAQLLRSHAIAHRDVSGHG
jgi:hypothetical protein